MTSIHFHMGHKVLRRFNVTEEQMEEMTNQRIDRRSCHLRIVNSSPKAMTCPTCVVTEKKMPWRSLTIIRHTFVRTTTLSWKKSLLFSYPHTGQASKNGSDVRICVVWTDVAWMEEVVWCSSYLLTILILQIAQKQHKKNNVPNTFRI